MIGEEDEGFSDADSGGEEAMDVDEKEEQEENKTTGDSLGCVLSLRA